MEGRAHVSAFRVLRGRSGLRLEPAAILRLNQRGFRRSGRPEVEPEFLEAPKAGNRSVLMAFSARLKVLKPLEQGGESFLGFEPGKVRAEA